MKYLLLLLIIFPFSLQAQKPTGKIELGYEDRYILLNQEREDIFYHTNSGKFLRYKLFTDITLGYQWKGLEAYGSVKTYFYPDYKHFNFVPVQTRYIIGLRYQVKRLEFRYEHMCSHSIDALVFRDGYDRISITYKIF